MALIEKTRIIVAGVAEGPTLKLAAPLSFWGGVCPKTATIIQAGHPDRGTCISGTILALPGAIGSSSSSSVLLELLYRNIAPTAIIMPQIDAILALGDLAAREMGYPTIPILQGPVDALYSGHRAKIDEGGTLTILPD